MNEEYQMWRNLVDEAAEGPAWFKEKIMGRLC